MLFSEANKFSQKTLYRKTSHADVYKFLSIFVRLSRDIYEIMHKINSNFQKKAWRPVILCF